MTYLTKLATISFALGTTLSVNANSISTDLYDEISNQVTKIISIQMEEAKSATLRSITNTLNAEFEKNVEQSKTQQQSKDEKND